MNNDIKIGREDTVKKVSYALGYDITDNDAKEHIVMLVNAGIEDMIQAGVPREVVENSETSYLVVATLIIFTNDNLNLSVGEHKTSLMYIANIDKLRSKEYIGIKKNES